MRLISPFPRYSIQLREVHETILMDGDKARRVSVGKQIVADFQQGGLMAHEIEAALRHFTFVGVPDGVNPLTRLSVYDTEGQPWDDETREELESFIEHQAKLSNDFIIVPLPKAPVPYDRYDEHSPEEIFATFRLTGNNPEGFLRYEQENERRAEVLEFFEAAQRGETPEPTEAEAGAEPVKSGPKIGTKVAEVVI